MDLCLGPGGIIVLSPAMDPCGTDICSMCLHLSLLLPSLVFTLLRNAPSSRIYVQIRAYGYVHVSFMFAFLYLAISRLVWRLASSVHRRTPSEILSATPLENFEPPDPYICPCTITRNFGTRVIYDFAEIVIICFFASQ